MSSTMKRHLASIVMALLTAAPTQGSEPQGCSSQDLFSLCSQSPITSVALSRDGKMLASGDVGQLIRLWDVATGREIRQLRHPRGVTALAFSGDGSLLASSGADQRVRVWEVATGKLRHALPQPQALCLGFSPSGRLLAAGGASLCLWDTASGTRARVLEGQPGTVLCLAFGDDRTLAAGGDDHTVRLWDVTRGSIVRGLEHEKGVLSLAFRPDGKLLATGGAQGPIHLWDTATGKLRGRLGGSFGESCGALAFSADGRVLAAGSCRGDRAIRRWDVADGKPLKPLKGFQDAVFPVAFGPESWFLAGADDGLLARVWDVTDPARERAVPNFELTTEEIRFLWDDLGSDNEGLALDAASTLLTDPAQTIPFLKKHLRPVAPFPPMPRLIADLDDERFLVRQRATEQLEQAGRAAEDVLRKTLADRPSLEVTRRIERLLDMIERGELSRDQLQALRAVAVLGRCDAPEAHQLLKDLAGGAPQAVLTRTAKWWLQHHQQK